MGLVARGVTHHRTRPSPIVVGDWFEKSANELPFLGRDELLGCAGLRAILGVDLRGATTSQLEKGRHTSLETSMASVGSLLRAKTLNDTSAAIDCGAATPTCTFASDWSFRYSAPPSQAGSIEMRSWRTRDNSLVNWEVLKSTREAIASTLVTGVALTVTDGLPLTSELVEVSPGWDALVEETDHLDRSITDIGRPLRLDEGAAAIVAKALAERYHYQRREADGTWFADLAGGRQGDNGGVELRCGATGWELAIVVPDNLPPVERQRSYRAGLMCLRDIVNHAKGPEPVLADLVERHISAIITATEQPDRHTASWVPVRSKSIAGPSVAVVAGRWYPVGVRVITTADIKYYDAAFDAQKWVGLRKRTFTRGFRAKTREAKRIFTVRRPGALVDAAGKRRPYFRYVAHTDVRDHVTAAASDDDPWFWEVRPRSIKAAEGVEPGGLLLVTGWSRTHHCLEYGEELFAMMHAFASVVRSRDPGAQIQTVYVAT